MIWPSALDVGRGGPTLRLPVPLPWTHWMSL